MFGLDGLSFLSKRQKIFICIWAVVCFAIACYVSCAYAEVAFKGDYVSLRASTVPATCEGGEMRRNTSTNLLSYCPAGTWDTVTLIGAAQTLTSKSMSGSSNTFTNLPLTSAVTGTLPVGNGGTGQTSAAAAFVSFYETVASAVGDILYGGTSGTPTRLAPNTSATKKYLSMTGTGAVGQAPTWDQPACSALTNAAASCSTDTTNASNISSGSLARNLIAAGTANYVLINDGSGNMSAEGNLALSRGGTAADLSATGGASKVLFQTSVGGAVTVARPACSTLSNAAASCSTDTTSASNISSGTLAAARGGTGQDLSASTGAVSVTAGTFAAGTLGVNNGGTGLTAGTSGGIPYYSSTSAMTSSGALTISQLVLGGGAGAAPTSLAAGSQYVPLTMGASAPGYTALALNQTAATSGQLLVSRGGTGQDLSASTGAVTVSSGTVAAGTLGINNGGTGQTTANPAFNALSPNTTKGDLISYSTVNARLAIGSDESVLIADSNATTGNRWSVNLTSYDLLNCTLAASVASSALTIALKDQGGADTSATSKCRVGTRSATAATGTFSTRSVAGALSVVVSSGSTLGCTSGRACYLYVYALDNAGTIELAVSQIPYDEGSIVTTTAEGGAGAADTNYVVYSTSARTGKAIRMIGRITITEATAGTWASNATEISLVPFEIPKIYAVYTTNAAQSVANTGETQVDFEDVESDPYSIVTTGTWVATAPKAGLYEVCAAVSYASGTYIAGNILYAHLYKNGSQGALLSYQFQQGLTTTTSMSPGCRTIVLAQADTIGVRFGNSRTAGATNTDAATANNWITVTYLGK